MTSNEKRYEDRYQRRKEKRDKHRAEKLAKYDNYDKLVSYNTLYWANRRSKEQTSWKADVQAFQMILPFNLEYLYQALKAEEDISEPFHHFHINERGHDRDIRAVIYQNRVEQRALCDNCFVPVITNGIIDTNAACQIGKGTDWMLNKLDDLLHRHYRMMGNHNYGYVVLFDIHGYFDSIVHYITLAMYDEAFKDKRIVNLLETLLIPMGYDDNRWFTNGRPRYDEAIEDPQYRKRGLGLGSQISQNTGVAYLSPLDHYIKQKLGIKAYIRYMDDGLCICKTKMEAIDTAKAISKYLVSYGVELSPKKTKVIPLGKWFTFLKVKHKLTSDGEVIRKINHKSVVKEKQRIHLWQRLIEEGKMTPESAKNSYAAWKGYALSRDATLIVEALDEEFKNCIGIDPPVTKLEKTKDDSREKRLSLNAAPLEW